MEGFIYIAKKSKRQNKRRKNGIKVAYFLPIFILIISMFAQFIFLRSVSAGNDDYPAAWKNVPMDSTLDNWKEWNRECTSFVAWRLHSKNSFEMPFNDNAINWKARALSMGYTVNSTPAVGSVAWFNYGHVAWVESVNNNGTVTIEQYNADYTGRYSEMVIAASSVSSYIHFKDLRTDTRIGTLSADGNLYIKDGSISAPWTLVSNGVASFQMSPNRIAVVDRAGNLSVKEGAIGAPWTLVSNGVSPNNFRVTDTRIGTLSADGNLYIKDGSISAPWTLVSNGVVLFTLPL
jgi:surface antigen